MTIFLSFSNQEDHELHNPKTLLNFKSFSDTEFTLNQLSKTMSLDSDAPFEITRTKSSIIRWLLLMKDSIAFHCKIAVELIKEQKEDVQKLHEYHKRWQAFTWAMIKMDEFLIPFTRWVNEVYKILYPGFPSFPDFSILRLFNRIWLKEVFNPLHIRLESYLLNFVKSFHQSWKDYSREKKLTNRCTKNKTSLSDYFPEGRSKTPLFS